MASGIRVMEKPIQLQQQQQQQPHETLKCPRCESSNTKFCYYNNYSLSQPRHFCKACKRYWTRGGTLRNVPVGGGCRKNKRVKRPISTTSVHVAATPSPVVSLQTSLNPNTNPDKNSIPSSNTTNSNNFHLNPLFYGLLPQNPSYPRFDTRVSSVNEILAPGYHLIQPHVNASGLGFSSSSEGGSLVANCHNSNLNFSSYNPAMYCGGSSSSSTSVPTMASLLASTLNQQQKYMGFGAYDGGSMVKDLKMEDTQNRMEWSSNNFNDQNKNHDQTEAVVSSDPNSLLWDTEGGGWIDPGNNFGSSISSLI